MSFIRGARTRGGFPKPGDLPVNDMGRHNRDGWIEARTHDSVQLGGKQYRNMKEWTRPCAICGCTYSVFEKAGTVDANSRFSNRTCDDHRGLMPAYEKGYIAWDKERGVMVPGMRCATVDTAELEKRLKEAEDGHIDTMQKAGGVRRAIHEELGLSLLGDGISYDTVKAAIRAKLAPYELGAAMKTAAEKMPWE